MRELSLTAVFEEAKEGGYFAYIEEIKGVNTQGDTMEEAEENLMDALEMVLEFQRMKTTRKQGAFTKTLSIAV